MSDERETPTQLLIRILEQEIEGLEDVIVIASSVLTGDLLTYTNEMDADTASSMLFAAGNSILNREEPEEDDDDAGD